MKKSKPLYDTITVNDSTSTASIYAADMKKIEVPQYYLYGDNGFPIICKNLFDALEMARKRSSVELLKGQEIKVLDLYHGKIVACYLDGKKLDSHGA